MCNFSFARYAPPLATVALLFLAAACSQAPKLTLLAQYPSEKPAISAAPAPKQSGVGSAPPPPSARPSIVADTPSESARALPPLPPPSSKDSHAFEFSPPRLSSPPSPCPAGDGWDGHACVTTTCPKGLAFVKGAGCVLCVGDCPSFPQWSERQPLSNDPTPFDDVEVRAIVSKVDLGECKQPAGPTGSSHATLGFLPTGRVGHVAIDGGIFAGTPTGACIIRKLSAIRVAPFGGPVRFVGKSFSL